MKKIFFLILFLGLVPVMANDNLETKNTDRVPQSDFTKSYQEQLAQSPHQLNIQKNEDSEYHDQVVLRFSRIRK